MPGCPLPLDTLPRPLQKHADEKAPPPLRMMGAKGLVPAVAPADLVTLLWFLSFDADAAVAATAVKTAEGLPDKLWGVALRADAVPGAVLDWLADRFAGRDPALELVLLNPATPDGTIARLAATVSQRLADIVRQNELRLLRATRSSAPCAGTRQRSRRPSTAPATSAFGTASPSSTSRSRSRRTCGSTASIPRRGRPSRSRPPPRAHAEYAPVLAQERGDGAPRRRRRRRTRRGSSPSPSGS